MKFPSTMPPDLSPHPTAVPDEAGIQPTPVSILQDDGLRDADGNVNVRSKLREAVQELAAEVSIQARIQASIATPLRAWNLSPAPTAPNIGGGSSPHHNLYGRHVPLIHQLDHAVAQANQELDEVGALSQQHADWGQKGDMEYDFLRVLPPTIPPHPPPPGCPPDPLSPPPPPTDSLSPTSSSDSASCK